MLHPFTMASVAYAAVALAGVCVTFVVIGDMSVPMWVIVSEKATRGDDAAFRVEHFPSFSKFYLCYGAVVWIGILAFIHAIAMLFHKTRQNSVFHGIMVIIETLLFMSVALLTGVPNLLDVTLVLPAICANMMLVLISMPSVSGFGVETMEVKYHVRFLICLSVGSNLMAWLYVMLHAFMFNTSLQAAYTGMLVVLFLTQHAQIFIFIQQLLRPLRVPEDQHIIWQATLTQVAYITLLTAMVSDRIHAEYHFMRVVLVWVLLVTMVVGGTSYVLREIKSFAKKKSTTSDPSPSHENLYS